MSALYRIKELVGPTPKGEFRFLYGVEPTYELFRRGHQVEEYLESFPLHLATYVSEFV